MESLRGRRWLVVVVLLAALAVGCTGQAPATTPGGPPPVGVRIPVPHPFRVAAGAGSVWVLSRGPRPCPPARPCTISRIDPYGGRLLQADPQTAKVERVAELSPGPIHPAVGAGWIWSSSAAAWGDTTRDDRILRIDPRTLGVVQVLHLGGNVPSVTFGLGSVWAAVATGSVVRIR